MTYVITIEIIEAKMNLMLLEINDKIRLDTSPNAIKEKFNESGTIFSGCRGDMFTVLKDVPFL
jgi:hypothetical protein